MPAAIDLLQQALELAPGFAAGWFDLGDAREQAGEREGAIEAFQQALAADPSDRQGAGLRLKLLNIGGHAMSADYVRSVFDQYASKFDDALAALSYSAPQMLLDAVQDVCGERNVRRNSAPCSISAAAPACPAKRSARLSTGWRASTCRPA